MLGDEPSESCVLEGEWTLRTGDEECAFVSGKLPRCKPCVIDGLGVLGWLLVGFGSAGGQKKVGGEEESGFAHGELREKKKSESAVNIREPGPFECRSWSSVDMVVVTQETKWVAFKHPPFN